MSDQSAVSAQPIGRPQGGFKSDLAKAAYWRMQYESVIGALADLIAEHRELVEAVEAVADQCPHDPNTEHKCSTLLAAHDVPVVLGLRTPLDQPPRD